jgi:hypothetical protein
MRNATPDCNVFQNISFDHGLPHLIHIGHPIFHDTERVTLVAPFVQEISDKLIKIKQPDVAEELKGHTPMRL